MHTQLDQFMKEQLDLLKRAVQESGCRADQIAANNPSIPVGDVLILIDDLAAGRLKIEHGNLIRDYSHVDKGTSYD